MPRSSNSPSLFDEVLQINISKLKKLGYLNPGCHAQGTLVWSRNGQDIGNIRISVSIGVTSFIRLDYNYRDQPRGYRVDLVSVPSNLGRGKQWFFRCPRTGKRCRILYCVGGYFLHREAFKECYYGSQIRSHETREIDRIYGSYFRQDKLYEQLHGKYFKTHYAGKPTKRYARIKKKLKEAEQITAQDYERLLCGIRR